jgi:hypothetical protein
MTEREVRGGLERGISGEHVHSCVLPHALKKPCKWLLQVVGKVGTGRVMAKMTGQRVNFNASLEVYRLPPNRKSQSEARDISLKPTRKVPSVSVVLQNLPS